MNIDLCTINWITISAIVTTIMAFIAGFALYKNGQQLKEIKRQWDETNRPRLVFSIVARQEMFLLKISNVGQQTASHIKLNFSHDFINDLLYKDIKNTFRKLQDKEFCIESGISKFFLISPIYDIKNYKISRTNENFTKEQINQWIDDNIQRRIEINGTYGDKYKIEETLSIDDYINSSMVIDDELTYAVKIIKNNLIVNNDQYYPIQKSLDIIARHICETK